MGLLVILKGVSKKRNNKCQFFRVESIEESIKDEKIANCAFMSKHEMFGSKDWAAIRQITLLWIVSRMQCDTAP